MKRADNQKISYEDIICSIYVGTGRVEKSFASKMLATLNPEKPILDSRIIGYLNSKGEKIGHSDISIDCSEMHTEHPMIKEEDIDRLSSVIH